MIVHVNIVQVIVFLCLVAQVSHEPYSNIYDHINDTAHNHNLRYQALILPMNRNKYYVQSTKYQLFKLIRETPQLGLDRCLTSSLIQFVAYFKYKIIEAYNAVCNIRDCYVCQ